MFSKIVFLLKNRPIFNPWPKYWLIPSIDNIVYSSHEHFHKQKRDTFWSMMFFYVWSKNSKLLKSRPPGAARTANLTPSLHSVLLPQYSWRGWIFSFLQFLQPKKIFTTKKVSGQKILWTWGDPPTVKQSWNFSKWKVVQKWKEMQKFAEKLCFSQK